MDKQRTGFDFFIILSIFMGVFFVQRLNAQEKIEYNVIEDQSVLAATASLATVVVSPGEPAVVPLIVQNFNNVGAISFYIRFKPGLLTFNGLSGLPIEGSTSSAVYDSTIIILWSANPSPPPYIYPTFNGTFVNLLFTYNGPGASNLTFLSYCNVKDQNLNPIPVTYYTGALSGVLTNTTQATVISIYGTTSGESVHVPVNYTGFSQNVGSLVQKITYDPGKLNYSGISTTGSLIGAAVSGGNGTITVTWNTPGGANINYPENTMNLDFIYTGTTTATVNFYQGCLIQASGGANIPVSYFNGTVSPLNIAGSACPGVNSVIYGGKVYNTVKIGTQCWLRENLNIGTKIPGTSEQTNNGLLEKYCYNDLENNCSNYGGLYQWNEMMQYVVTSGSKGICPQEWHLPSDAEYTTLTDYLGGLTVAGGKMKEAGTSHWAVPNTGATNESGYTSLPGGERSIDGSFGTIGVNGTFWSSTDELTNSWKRVLEVGSGTVSKVQDVKSKGFSVRCLKDPCTTFSTVSSSITCSSSSVCAGTGVTFTATVINGGDSPAYQWIKNGLSVGTSSPTYSYTPINGDVIKCIVTSSLSCITGNPAISNQVTITVIEVIPVAVSIVSPTNMVCSGTLVSFTATPVNGGNLPVFQWKVNGIATGTSTTVYNYAPENNDLITCQLTSNASCATGNPAISNTVTMTVNQILPVTVFIVPTSSTVCSGTSVSFTATPVNGGSLPGYQWKVNGSNSGTSTSVLNYIPANNDQVTCILTSNATCTSGNPATSNTVTITVNQILPVSVSIVPSVNPVCAGANVSFTATPLNGGLLPTYQWKVNGINIGTSTTVFNYTPTNNDLVKCELTSNDICTSGNPATSNTVTMTVTQLQASVSIVPSVNPVCTGATVTITATPVNGGTAPVYQWKVNSIDVGTSSSFYNLTPANNDQISCSMISNAQCVIGNPANSNTVTIMVNPLPVPVIIGPNNVFAGSTGNVYTTLAGQSFYTWAISAGGTISGGGTSGSNTVSVNWNDVGTQWIKVNYTDLAGCTATSSTSYTVMVNPAPFITVTSPDGGESWPTGALHVITWTDNITDNVKIDLYKGGVYSKEITPSTPPSGAYSWFISQGQQGGSDYKVKITSVADNTVFDFSNGDFTIAQSVQTTRTVENMIIPNGQSACFDATQTIFVAGNGTIFVVESGGSATMIAGQSIIYYAGTSISSGGTMLGKIAPSGPFCVTATVPKVLTGGETSVIGSKDKAFTIFPNPTSDKFTLAFRGESVTTSVRVDIYGMCGDKILSKELNGIRQQEFSLISWPAGIYFLRVIYGGISETVKVMKL